MIPSRRRTLRKVMQRPGPTPTLGTPDGGGRPCPASAPSKHLILCHPLLLLHSMFPSIRVLSNEVALCIRWPEYWSFSFSISPSNEYSGLITFRIDWFDILSVQGTLRGLIQHHSLKVLILSNSAFLMVQRSLRSLVP